MTADVEDRCDTLENVRILKAFSRWSLSVKAADCYRWNSIASRLFAWEVRSIPKCDNLVVIISCCWRCWLGVRSLLLRSAQVTAVLQNSKTTATCLPRLCEWRRRLMSSILFTTAGSSCWSSAPRYLNGLQSCWYTEVRRRLLKLGLASSWAKAVPSFWTL